MLRKSYKQVFQIISFVVFVALFVYRLIVATLIGNFFDDPFFKLK